MTTTRPRHVLSFSRMVCLVLLLFEGKYTDAFVVDPKDRNGSCPSSLRTRTINSNPVPTRGPGVSPSAKHLFPFKNNNSNNYNSPVDKGFNLLEIASQIVPQGAIVSTAKESWRFLWKRFMVELAPQDKNGTYQRPKYPFQGGGTIGSQQYPIETNRYHVYVGNPCPWCHRVRLVVNILRLQDDDAVGMTMLLDDPIKASRGGWVFATPPPQASSSTSRSNKIHDLRQLYEHLSPGYQGRCTAPLLVDWKTRTIISNESKDIVRMLPLLKRPNGIIDLTPATLQKQIDETNEWVYAQINNGVYQCGFATSQQSYDQASVQVSQGLDRAEAILTTHPYLCGESLTESDILLLPTMLRFDAVYAPLFGAGGSRHWKLATDFPHIHRWMKHCWHDIPGVADSIDLDDASKSYYKQLFPLNPGGIVPSVTITPRRLGLTSE